MYKRTVEYTNYVSNIFPTMSNFELKQVTFQVTENCNLGCTYCYQTNKTEKIMSFETAKEYIDNIFNNRLNKDSIWYQGNSKGIVFEFIGGEPLLEIDLIEQITEYIEQKLLNIPVEEENSWLLFHMYSFSSNGTLYFTDKVQNYINKYRKFVNISITVDGDRELHDTCRLTKEGSQPTYNTAIAAALVERAQTGSSATKLTFSPENIHKVADGVINLIDLGFDFVAGNPVFEDVWKPEHAKIYYLQLKKIVDWIVDNNYQNSCLFRPFEYDSYLPYNEEKLKRNYCGVCEKYTMTALDYRGNIYPCIRFMDSSLHGKVDPIIIGDSKNGIYENNSQIKELLTMTTESMSSEECLKCPIAGGCAWCSAYAYQCNGNFKYRTTFNCLMHVAEACATKYLMQRSGEKENIRIPKEKGIQVLPLSDWYLLN